jgi:hypothetical protein
MGQPKSSNDLSRPRTQKMEVRRRSGLDAVPAQHDVTIFRQNWQAGKLIGQPQVALKLPFAFPLVSGGSAYDFSRDLSTVAYAPPGRHADLYLLSQK